MNFKEKMEERKQRKEAISYFRKNNSEFFSASKWCLLILVVLGSSILLGLLLGELFNQINLIFSYAFLLVAYLIVQICVKIAKTTNRQLMILCMVGYTLMIITCYIFTFIGFEYLRYLDFNLLKVLFNQILNAQSIISFIVMGLGYVEIASLMK